MSDSIEKINDELKQIVSLFCASDYHHVINRSERVIEQITGSQGTSVPQGLMGMYAISLLQVGEIDKSISAFEEENQRYPSSLLGKFWFDTAKQIKASQTSHLKKVSPGFSDTEEGKKISERLWELVKDSKYKLLVAQKLQQAAFPVTRYIQGANNNEPWVDLLTASLWAIESYQPYRILIVGDDIDMVARVIKNSSQYSRVDVFQKENLVTGVSKHINSLPVHERYFELIIVGAIASSSQRCEVLSRLLPSLGPSCVLLMQSDASNDSQSDRDLLKSAQADSIYAESQDGILFLAKSPQPLLLAKVI